MEAQVNEIEINGVKYVKKDSVQNNRIAVNTDGLKYCIIRTYSAGVHAGFLKDHDGKIVKLVNSRRIWFWDGAASLSQLAVSGTSKPENCKFAVEVPEIILTEAIEILPCTEYARENIQGVLEWEI